MVIDRLTGELTVTRVDILMDLGRSLNPDIDRGQVIGGFVQGMGWVTTEELLYSETGELLSHSPNNYKIPGIECMPRVFRVDFLENPDNPINLLGSKAVGEPPFVLGISVGAAAKSALVEPVAGPFAAPVVPGDQRRDLEASRPRLTKMQASVNSANAGVSIRPRSRGPNPCRQPSLKPELHVMAIAKARDGIAAGQSPFGAIIVRRRRGGGGDAQHGLARHRPDRARRGQLHPRPRPPRSS